MPGWPVAGCDCAGLAPGEVSRGDRPDCRRGIHAARSSGRGGRLRRERCTAGQQPAGQPNRPLPRTGVLVAEAQHQRADREHDRLDGVPELAPRRRDRTQLGIQRGRPPGPARPQNLCPRSGGPQPSADRCRPAIERASDPAMPRAIRGQTQRLADHLRAVAPSWNRPRGSEHMCCAAPITARPPRRDRAHPVQHPHVPRACVPPR